MANLITIDLDPQGLYAITGPDRGATRAVRALAWAADGDTGDVPPALTPDSARVLGEQLREKLKAAGIAPAPVLVAVGRDRVILKELKFPPVAPSEEPAIVRFQVMKELSESPEDVVLDYVPLATEGGGDRRAMAVVLRKDLFGAIQTMCQAAGLRLAGVTPRPYAVAAGLSRTLAAGGVPLPEHRLGAVAAVTLGPGGGEFTVARDGQVVMTTAIPGPVVASEPLLVARLRQNLMAYSGQHPTHPVEAVYLAEVGGGWAGRLGSALGVPVHAYDPLAGAVPELPEGVRGRFAAAAGLLAARAAGPLPINFVAPHQPQAAENPAKRRILAIAALALILFCVVGVLGYMAVEDKRAGVGSKTQKRNELKTAVEKAAPDAKKANDIGSWERRQVVWLDVLHDLTANMPADDSVRVSQLTGTPMPVSKDGKQEAQAKLDLKLLAVSADPVYAMLSAIDRDSAGGKYYSKTNVTIGGTSGAPPAGSRHLQPYTLTALVHGRAPVEWQPSPEFPSPKRSWGVFGAGPSIKQ